MRRIAIVAGVAALAAWMLPTGPASGGVRCFGRAVPPANIGTGGNTRWSERTEPMSSRDEPATM